MFDDWGAFSPLILLRRVFKNPLVLFIYGFLSKWYIIIMAGSLIVTYWVFKGLKDAGVIDAAETILVRSIEETKGVAQNCIPQITNLQRFFNCLNNPSSTRYVPSQYDADLQKDLQQGLQNMSIVPVPVAPDSKQQDVQPNQLQQPSE